uniref:SER_THR_PHOSPHATASE domain-containing protein n=1 Tax=Caenorhabditis japonica TaxID=281687 RepID=A0A8R1DQ23_CAEJA
MCCRTPECFTRNPFYPLNRFGIEENRKIANWKKMNMDETDPEVRKIIEDVTYLDNLIIEFIIGLFISSVVYFLWNIYVTRMKVSNSWNNDGEFVDPVLLELFESPPLSLFKLGHLDTGGYPVTGQHTLLDYSRLLTARLYREEVFRKADIIDIRVLHARLQRFSLRQMREARSPIRRRWQREYRKLPRHQKFLRINSEWVYMGAKMHRKKFLYVNYAYQEYLAAEKLNSQTKMHLQCETSAHYDGTFLPLLDECEIQYLVNLGVPEDNYYVIMFEAADIGHHATKIERPLGDVYHNRIFDAVYYHGPYYYSWKPEDLIQVFEDAKELFLNEPLCLELKLPMVIVGDIRGRYIDLHRWISIIGLPYRRKILFLGGYLDKNTGEYEQYNVDTLAWIAAMKVAFPRHVFMLRGAAENIFSFAPRFNVALDNAVLASARHMCNCMPLIARLSKKYLATSSGLSPHLIYNPRSINTIDRPMSPDNLTEEAKHILFGQPSSTWRIFESDEKTGIYRFGMKAVDDVCAKMNIRSIIRSRNELTINPLFMRDERLITISSCPTEHTPGVAMMIEEGIGKIFLKLRFQADPANVASKEEVQVVDEVDAKDN